MTAAQPIEIELHPPRVIGQRAAFSWAESRPSGLYHKNNFDLEFPASVPLERVPMSLWWTVFLLCVHSHWPLLRPCRIRLPVRLEAGTAEVWRRLLKSYATTLDALNPGGQPRPEIELVMGAETPEPSPPVADTGRCATAFSGGKDSLAQVGLLCEMGHRPMLVTTTSPLPPLLDHHSAFRRRTMAEVQRRRGVELVEVASDFRATWSNLVPRERGYPLSLNEISDTFLYTATLAVTCYARGVTHLFLASENEVASNSVEQGVYLQHAHFMYSALTQAGIAALLRPFGLHYGSLTTALQSSQVQELVTSRYPDLSDLQCSCWRITETRKACSECSECKRLAWVSLSLGGSPADQGIDFVWMLNHYDKHGSRSSRERPHPPNQHAAAGFKAQFARAILGVSPARLLAYLLRQHPRSLLGGSGWRAFNQFLKIRASTRREHPGEPPRVGYRAGYLQLLEEPIRERLRAILTDQFEPEAEEHYAVPLANLLTAIAWMTQPVRSSDHRTRDLPSDPPPR
ncbi:MAG: hypothetical protein WCH77_05500 [Planctomycetota bacterium]